ncbi:MAG: type II toxin-antitoxin system Phd/YefM family antitoxin [Bifidobacteriaceae bacterium]|nr:type II toxin-antitoxin system Phd/YefM family antitoxin [Bifidobacteriaceae bacterium]
METVSLVEAKANLSKLVDQAAGGSPFVITKHGRPLVMVSALPTPVAPPPRIGFLKDRFEDYELPEDFDTMMAGEIEELFEGGRQ